MKCCIWIGVIACAPAFAHVISMSAGTATVKGDRVEYILRMPDFEIANPANLFAHIRFSSGFERGRLIDQECHHDAATSSWLCAANYGFSRPVEQLGVECSFYEVTVANHIHVLHAERDGKTDRAILDSAFPSATLAFRPPTAFERAIEQGMAGAIRIWTGTAVLMLLLAISAISRTKVELASAAAAFLVAQVSMTLIVWQAPPRFAEATAALALAYLGIEAAAFPDAGGRWLVALVFGAFSGLYFSAFLADSGYVRAYVLTGAAVASLVVLASAGFAMHFLARFRMQRLAAVMVAGAGCVWFTISLCARSSFSY